MITNLCFHGIGRCTVEREPGERRYWITRDVFLEVLDLVAEAGDVRLSFDDGNRSDFDVALPALEERGLRATIFALAGRLDDPASLSAADLVALRGAGMSIGSHGWSHIPFRGLEADDARREFVDARTELKWASGGPIDDVALPLGRYDRAALTGLRRAGYRTVFTSDRFPAKEGARLQARYSLTASDDIETVAGILRRPRPLSETISRAKSLVKRSI